jgi:hypothetical protein
MLRIVKLNLYNFKLFKSMKENWSNYNDELDHFLVDVLKMSDELKAVDVVQIIQKEEKNRFMEINPGILYFLFDTTVNAFVGFSRVSFVIEEKENKDFNIEFKICPKYENFGYEKTFIELLSKVFVERNKAKPIYRVKNSDTKISKVMIDSGLNLINSYKDYLFYF